MALTKLIQSHFIYVVWSELKNLAIQRRQTTLDFNQVVFDHLWMDRLYIHRIMRYCFWFVCFFCVFARPRGFLCVTPTIAFNTETKIIFQKPLMPSAFVFLQTSRSRRDGHYAFPTLVLLYTSRFKRGGHCAVHTFRIVRIESGTVIIRSLRLRCCKQVLLNIVIIASVTSRSQQCDRCISNESFPTVWSLHQ